jgi:hypothetical protein
MAVRTQTEFHSAMQPSHGYVQVYLGWVEKMQSKRVSADVTKVKEF